MRSGFIGGQGRTSLVNTNGTVDITGAAASLDFGSFNVQPYTRFTGLFLVDSVPDASANLRIDYLADSGGSTIVSSTIAIDSGGTAFSFINHGYFAQISLTDIASDTPYNALVLGEPIR